MELAHFIQLTEADIRWRVACHEAGHVAALYHQRRVWTRVHIIPRDGFLGMVEGVRTPYGGSDLELEEHLVYLLAGAAAVRLLVPHTFTGGWIDQVKAWRATGWLCSDPGQRAAALSHARTVAEQLCARYRPGIQALAETLVQMRELDKRNACRIVSEALAAANRPGGSRVHVVRVCPFSPITGGASKPDG